ncbi:MAG TPA: NOB1 family endonuclease [Candidatus Caldiarchaeum subterraneum]|uniref:NOB1 family endonuclease n=1 Tax=Caldiarchaeum subterraneum TaxID=311458 RepID=A0A832ZVU7_CALS0|nr:NOB1 family endonuclease [Candidatus Caldarchaeum subterraneum]
MVVRRSVVVLDTAALLSMQLESLSDRLVTSRLVVEEVRYGNLSPERVEAAVEAGVLEVLQPSGDAVGKIRESAGETGDLLFLSDADVEVLALAYEFMSRGYEVKIATDDYSVQNVALRLGIRVAGVRHPKIRKTVRWVIRCRRCGRKFKTFRRSCPFCGGEVARDAE